MTVVYLYTRAAIQAKLYAARQQKGTKSQEGIGLHWQQKPTTKSDDVHVSLQDVLRGC